MMCISDPITARLRVNWFGQVVVQVGVRLYTQNPNNYEVNFRDAKSHEIPHAMILLSNALQDITKSIKQAKDGSA